MPTTYPRTTVAAIVAGLAGGIASALITSAVITTLSVTGLSTLSGGVKIGSGTTIKHSYSASSSRDFAALGVGACSSTNLTLAGATTDDSIAWSLPNSLVSMASTTAKAWVATNGTVTFKVCNYGTASTADPAAGVIRATVFKYY